MKKLSHFYYFKTSIKSKSFFSTLAPDNRCYGHLAVSVARNVPVAEAKTAKYTAYPYSSGSASLCPSVC